MDKKSLSAAERMIRRCQRRFGGGQQGSKGTGKNIFEGATRSLDLQLILLGREKELTNQAPKKVFYCRRKQHRCKKTL